MPIIKLDAIDSTNDYLKQLAKEKWLENYTAVMAFEQTKGRGQMGSEWVSESGKNLTISVLVKDVPQDMISIYDFNIAVALAAVGVLTMNGIVKVNVKWPNDIMAENKKVGGILIENTLKSDGSFTSVVGFGLNLNQTDFEHLPQANSLTNITGKNYDLDEMAKSFIKSLKLHLILFPERADEAWAHYNDLLFKKDKPSAFEFPNGDRFMGIIKCVTRDGKLAVLLNDDNVAYYELKEVKLLY
ncbi:biotin--[acetyl-CoA-carboxylase] ligase [Flavobacterium buctense]|uniref:Biotin--[acetyl-CoA-carboxylase] ligase n=1 Tax=Flavobacterium buctense TaxID=1648146 RepID=A0ABU9E4S2_9FLAO|nr:biotin--[acetyl-CoA-carboxylase] ligase [Flavobacterium buctense]